MDTPTAKVLWASLVDARVIDASGKLLLNVKEVTQERLDCVGYPHLTDRLVYFFRNVVKRNRFLRVPSHLLPFVERHLDAWLENAVRALLLNADEHYVVDQDRSGTNPDLNPIVTIIDPGTGTDQSTSQWDGGLHQFLQLKEGCQISPLSLKAIFISNVSYFKRYDRLVGLTGTLGSEPEREFLRNMYESDFITIPTAHGKKFSYRPATVVTTEDRWLRAIADEVKFIALKSQRSMLIFCESIKDVKLVREHLMSELMSDPVKIHSYTRDYEQFSFERNDLDIGQVIVATNLAGRGTDIKISERLRKKGGLHVCLTYLPDNVRVEEQATGRAGRKGDPGSATLILCHGPDGDAVLKGGQWNPGKIFEKKEVRNRQELHRVSKLQEEYERSINTEEECLRCFTNQYNKLKSACSRLKCDEEERDVFCLSALDQWALWLDSMEKDDDELSSGHLAGGNCVMLKRMEAEWSRSERLSLSDLDACPDWVTPSRRIRLAKHWSVRKKNKKLYQAARILDRLMSG